MATEATDITNNMHLPPGKEQVETQNSSNYIQKTVFRMLSKPVLMLWLLVYFNYIIDYTTLTHLKRNYALRRHALVDHNYEVHIEIMLFWKGKPPENILDICRIQLGEELFNIMIWTTAIEKEIFPLPCLKPSH